MANLPRSESKRRYSWWWDSHISPKNSKWLQENLTDMDSKVKAMIKLLEEDADSFARKAEMYYKKRPELMKLVEEFYRAYRALAERYDHATGALRQAQRTISEAFPNGFLDESPHGSSGNDMEPHTPEMPPPARAFIDPDDLQKDALALSPDIHVMRKVVQFTDENDALSGKKGLKQLNDMFGSGNGTVRVTLPEGRVRKGLNFQEEGGENSVNKLDWESRELQAQGRAKDEASDRITSLQQDICNLSTENENLKNQITEASERAIEAEKELRSLHDKLYKLKAEKDADILEYQERILSLENQLLSTQNNLENLNDEMVMTMKKLTDSEELNDKLSKLRAEKEADILEYQERIYSLENQLVSSQNDLEKLNDEMVITMKKLYVAEELNGKLSKLKDERDADIFEYQERISSLENQLISTENDLEKLNDKMVIAVKKLNDAEELNDKLSKLKAEKDADILEYQERISSLENQFARTQNDLQKLNDETVLMMKKLDDAEELNDKLSKLKAERISSLENHLVSTQNDLEKLNDEVARTVKKLNDAEELNDKLSKMKVEKDADILEYQERISSTGNQLVSTQNDLEKLNDEMVRTVKKLNDAEELNDKLSKLKAEKDADILEYQGRISSLENQLLSTQNDLEKLNDEMVRIMKKLSDAEELNLSLQVDFNTVEKRANMQEDELNQRQIEMEKLLFTLEDRNEQCIQAEMALLSKEKLLIKSQEEIKLSSIEIQKQIEKLKGLEVENKGLQFEMGSITEENKHLNDQNTHLNQVIHELREEIKVFEEKIRKLEDEVGLHVGEKEILHQEAFRVKEDKKYLEQQHHDLEEQLTTVSRSSEFLQVSLKELEDENSKLKEVCKKHEADKQALEQKQTSFEEVIEKNALLENSLSEAKVELSNVLKENEQREKLNESLNFEISTYIHEKEALASQVEILTLNLEIFTDANSSLENQLSSMDAEVNHLSTKLKEFDETCQSLQCTKSVLLADKESLISKVGSITLELESREIMIKELKDANLNLSTENAIVLDQVEILMQSVERITQQNSCLENSLSNANAEVELLRLKLDDSEQTYQYLENQKACLLAEKESLISQVEDVIQKLEISDSLVAEMKVEIMELSRQRNLVTDQVIELQDCIRLEKQEHEVHIQSLESQLTKLTDQISFLQEKNLLNKKDLELEQNNVTGAFVEIFILQRILHDICEKNSILSTELTKHLEECRSLEQLTTHLEQENHMQRRSIATLSDRSIKLRKGIHILKNELIAEKELSIDGIADDELIDVTADEIRRLQNRITETELDCQRKNLEISVLLTFIKQIGLDAFNMRSDNCSLEKNLKLKAANLLISENKICELDEMNKKLMKDIEAGIRREELLEQQMNLETSTLATVVNQMGLDVAFLRSENCRLETDLETKTEELIASEKKQHELIGLMEQLTKEVVASNQREEILEQQMSIEIAVLLTLLKQFGLHKHSLECELDVKIEELRILEDQKLELMGLNSEMKKNLEAIVQREEMQMQQMSLQITVLLTFIKQLELDMADANLGKCHLEKELGIRTQDLLGLQDKTCELFAMNEQLRKDVEASNQREELLKQKTSIEISVLFTFIKQLELDMANMKSENIYLENELGIRIQDVLDLKDNKCELLAMNEQLMKDLEASNQREELLKQQMGLEISVLATLVKQLELDADNLNTEKYCLEKEINMKTDDLLSLGSKKNELQDLSEKLKNDLDASRQREELLSEKLDIETSILLSLIKELGLDVTNVRAEKYFLQKELQTKSEDLQMLRKNMLELQDLNEILLKDLEAGNQREDLYKQQMNIELSVIATLLKQMTLDAINLSSEKSHVEKDLEMTCEKLSASEEKKNEVMGLNEQLMKDVEESNKKEELLRTKLEASGRHLQELQLSLQASKYEIANLTEEKKIIAEELSDIKQKSHVLEEETGEIIAEALKLEHLYEIFKCIGSERLLELKSFNSHLKYLQIIKSGLDSEINQLNRKISDLESEKDNLLHNVSSLEEEFRNRFLILEFDLNVALGIYEEVNEQAENFKHKLMSKEKQLAEMSLKLVSSDAKNEELRLLIGDLQLENEGDKLLKEELEKKIMSLSEALSQSMEEIKGIREANRMLQSENSKIHEEVNQLMIKEKNLITKLQKTVDEVEQCEGNIAALLTQNQVSTVYAAVYRDKVNELLSEREISSIVQEEMRNLELVLMKEFEDELHKKLEALEVENRGLTADVDVYFSLLTSLEKAIAAVEEQTKSIEKNKSMNHNSDKDYQACEVSEDQLCTDAAEDLLKRLISKLEAIQKVITDTGSILEHEKSHFTSSPDVANKEIKGLHQRVISGRKEVQEIMSFIPQVGGALDDTGDNETTKRKHGPNMKDIELDQASSSLPYKKAESYSTRTSNADIDDQLWEAAERDCSKPSTNGPSIAIRHGIETIEEGMSEHHYAKSMDEKEVSIDKLEVPKRALASQREWSQKVLKGLSSDARKLSDLEESIEEVKTKIGSSHMEKFPANFGFDTLKAQLKTVEGDLAELVDTNKKLINKVESYSSFDGNVIQSDENGLSGKGQISKQARVESDKVGRLELDLQKIQYVLLKLEEEHENRRHKTAHRKARVILRDYLYGRRDNSKNTKKSHLCGCMRPKTKGEN